MKLVLKGFSQKVDFTTQQSQSFFEFVDEESGGEFELPVTDETLGALQEILSGRPEEEPEEPELEEGEEEEPPPAPPPPAAPQRPTNQQRKRMVPSGPASEGEVPPL